MWEQLQGPFTSLDNLWDGDSNSALTSGHVEEYLLTNSAARNWVTAGLISVVLAQSTRGKRFVMGFQDCTFYQLGQESEESMLAYVGHSQVHRF